VILLPEKFPPSLSVFSPFNDTFPATDDGRKKPGSILIFLYRNGVLPFPKFYFPPPVSPVTKPSRIFPFSTSQPNAVPFFTFRPLSPHYSRPLPEPEGVNIMRRALKLVRVITSSPCLPPVFSLSISPCARCKTRNHRPKSGVKIADVSSCKQSLLLAFLLSGPRTHSEQEKRRERSFLSFSGAALILLFPPFIPFGLPAAQVEVCSSHRSRAELSFPSRSQAPPGTQSMDPSAVIRVNPTKPPAGPLGPRGAAERFSGHFFPPPALFPFLSLGRYLTG